MANISRVVHIISSLSHGGAEKLAMELAKQQVQSGINVTICFVNSAQTIGNEVEVEENFLRNLNQLGISAVPLDQPDGTFYWKTRTKNLKKIIADLNPDIIHTHLGRGLMLLLLSKVKVPTVMTIHSVHVGFPNVLFKIFRFLNVRYVAVSSSIADRFEPHVKKQIEIIFNGINVEKFQPRVLPHTQLSKDFQFVAVGRILPPKNYPLLIDAVRMLEENPVTKSHPWLLKIAGDGNLLDEMRTKVSDLALTRQVEFLGGCDDVPQLLNESDAFIMSSDYEGMPMAMLEAMSIGLPVVSTNFAGIEDLVQNEESALLADVGDAQQIATNMARLLISSELRQELASEAQKNAKTFSIRITHEKYLELYSRAMKVKA